MRKITLVLSNLILLLSFWVWSVNANYYSSWKSLFPNKVDYYKLVSPSPWEWLFELNGKKEFNWGKEISHLKFSKKGQFFWFTKKWEKGDFSVVTINWEDATTFKKISGLVISGENYSYIWNDWKSDILVFNGKAIEKFTKIEKISLLTEEVIATVNLDGKKFLYSSKQWIISDFEDAAGIYNSDNYSRSVIPVKIKWKWFLSENWKLLNEQGYDLIVDVLFSKNEEQLFYTVKEWNIWFIINQQGKIVSEKHNHIAQFSVSDTWEQVAYTYYEAGKWVAVLSVNGKVIDQQKSIYISDWTETWEIYYKTIDEKGNTKYVKQ